MTTPTAAGRRRGAADDAGSTIRERSSTLVERWLADETARHRTHLEDGRVVAVEGPLGISRYQWEGHHLVDLVEPDGRRASFAYDTGGRLVAAQRGGRLTRYTYAADRLVDIDHGDHADRFRHDERGRLRQHQRGDAGTIVYRYDEADRVVEYRTASVTCRLDYDAVGRVASMGQVIGGVEVDLRYRYDEVGRLASMTIGGPLDHLTVTYDWDARGRPSAIGVVGPSIGGRRGGDPSVLASFEHDDAALLTRIRLGNGIVEESRADPLGGRLLERRWAGVSPAAGCPDDVVVHRVRYDGGGRVTGAGGRTYRYDDAGRVRADDGDAGAIAIDYVDGTVTRNGSGTAVRRDRRDRVVLRGPWTYQWDDADQLVAAWHRRDVVVRNEYDGKGRLTRRVTAQGVQRFVYGLADEVVAVTDDHGRIERAFVRTPLGCVAELVASESGYRTVYRHHDASGTVLATSDDGGRWTARPALDAYGLPLEPGDGAAGEPAVFHDREGDPATGLHQFGARWYDPRLGAFLTPDTWTACPDDRRLLDPRLPAGEQAALRDLLLGDWLARPERRALHDFCSHDPVNAVDPNGHWSFGGVLLSVLGALWTLPNTAIGLVIEVTCLVGEVLRWLVWLVTAGNVSWETPGFDVAASGRLNAFALVFSGGWLGSFPSLLGITFGNVFFTYKGWRDRPEFGPERLHYPSAYCGDVAIQGDQALYEHELRHTNQYGWFGPFYLLGLPIFGVYLWDVIIHGSYAASWLETDAREHAGI